MAATTLSGTRATSPECLFPSVLPRESLKATWTGTAQARFRAGEGHRWRWPPSHGGAKPAGVRHAVRRQSPRARKTGRKPGKSGGRAMTTAVTATATVTDAGAGADGPTLGSGPAADGQGLDASGPIHPESSEPNDSSPKRFLPLYRGGEQESGSGDGVQRTCGAASLQRVSQDSKLCLVERHIVVRNDGTTGLKLVNRGPKCASTYVAMAPTCSDDCPRKAEGDCYPVASGPATRNLIKHQNAAAFGHNSTNVVAEEVHLIDTLYVRGVPQDGPRAGGRPIRLNVAGDVRTEREAWMLGGALGRYHHRRGGPVFSVYAFLARCSQGSVRALHLAARVGRLD